MADFSSKKICYFPNIKKNRINKNLKIKAKDKEIFIENLYKFGYCRIKKQIHRKNATLLTKAFQRRFRQNLINGKIDKECLLISKSL